MNKWLKGKTTTTTEQGFRPLSRIQIKNMEEPCIVLLIKSDNEIHCVVESTRDHLVICASDVELVVDLDVLA